MRVAIDCLDSVCSPAAEQEQTVLTQRQTVLQHDDGSQAVYALSQVCVPHRNVVVANLAQVNHDAEWSEEELQRHPYLRFLATQAGRRRTGCAASGLAPLKAIPPA